MVDRSFFSSANQCVTLARSRPVFTDECRHGLMKVADRSLLNFIDHRAVPPSGLHACIDSDHIGEILFQKWILALEGFKSVVNFVLDRWFRAGCETAERPQVDDATVAITR